MLFRSNTCFLDFFLRILKIKFCNKTIILPVVIFYIRGGMGTENISKLNHETSIWAQDGRECVVEKAPQ